MIIETERTDHAHASVVPTGRFLRNAWYPILWSSDLEPDAIVDRIVLNEPILFYRTDAGMPVAIGDLCPHRFAPLHLGKRIGSDRIRCGYHGLEFDSTGACVRNPHRGERIPANARVRYYPLVEKHCLIWIWMGSAPPAQDRIPDFSIFDDPLPGTLSKFDSIKLPANYELIMDNLMDLSHTAFLHDGLLGNDATTQSEIIITQEGATVTVSRVHKNTPVVKTYDLMYRQDGRAVDSWDSIRWDAPASCLVDSTVVETGGERKNATGLYAVHLLTPETNTSTHYLFNSVRQNAAAGMPPTPETAKIIGDLRRTIFVTQDSMMISAQQKVLEMFPEETLHPVLFSVDAGPARYRRLLREMLDADVARESPANRSALV